MLDLIGKLTLALAEEGGAPAGGAPAAGGWEQMIGPLTMFLPLILIFYLLIWRPESKRRKEHQQMLDTVKRNDKVVVSGICGTVVDVEKDEIVVMVDPERKVKMHFRREAIQAREPAESDEKR